MERVGFGSSENGGVRRLVLYGKPRCSLCERALEVVEGVRASLPAHVQTVVEQVDIRESAFDWARFRHEVPVVELDGRVVFRLRVDEGQLRRLLTAEGVSDE